MVSQYLAVYQLHSSLEHERTNAEELSKLTKLCEFYSRIINIQFRLQSEVLCLCYNAWSTHFYGGVPQLLRPQRESFNQTRPI